MTDTPHPFVAVSELDRASGRQLELIQTEAGVVRLRDDAAGLWILIAAEDGSIMDRWAADEITTFLRLDADTVAAGPKAILAAIDAARAATAASDRSQHSPGGSR